MSTMIHSSPIFGYRLICVGPLVTHKCV